ncbi:MAG: hypothetical protein KF850_33725 [Labilithrix sp.]|nr:hypothetical protein [Labilithrix sp.]
MKYSLFVAAAAVATLVSSASVARADDDATSVAAARTIGLEGLRLAEAGNCKDAIDKLDRSEKLHHAPTTLAKLGECHIQGGRLVLGVEMLRRVVREQLPADAPPAFAAAKVRAQKLVDETQPRIGQLRVTVAVPPGVVPVVTVDGDEIPAAMLDIDRPTDPGTHSVEATAPGYKKASQAVTLKDGERLAIQLTPEAAPSATPAATPAGAAPADAATPATPDAPSSTPRASSSTSRTVGWVLLGVGAAGLVTGGVAGGLALGTKSSLDDACGANRGACPPNQEGRIDRLQRESLISTIGFTVGVVGAVGGAALLFFAPATKPAAATSPTRPTVSVGLGSVSLGGSF